MPSYLKRRGQIWHLQKTLRFQGRSINIRRSTGECDRAAAEEVAHAILEAERHKLLYGPHVRKTFHEAATQYLALPGNRTANNRYHLDLLLPYLGSLVLDDLYQDHPMVQQFIHDRRAAGRANNTINRSLEKLRCVLNRATEWREAGKPWLQVAPKIRLLPRQDKTFPTASEAPGYPLSRAQADCLMAELRRRTRTSHLADMVEFALYTGCRESEITALQWDWERQLDFGEGDERSVFVLPALLTKTARSRVVVLNSRVQQVIERRRGVDETHVFTFNGHPVGNINNTAWKVARSRAKLDNVRGRGKHFRVHDLRTTFATWLRQAGVGREDRKVLLGHAVDDITTHYSHAELATLLEFSERTVELETSSWKHAYASFYRTLGAGRTLSSFCNSFKNARDVYDAHIPTGRIGWRQAGADRAPANLPSRHQAVWNQWSNRSREELWERVRNFSDLRVTSVPSRALNDLDVQAGEREDRRSRTEGGRKVAVSSRVERDPALRDMAIALQGTSCVVCGWDFAEVYGDWGAGYIEVHHLKPLGVGPGERLTDPEKDLAVLCANCHRMVHRRHDMVLTVEELQAKIDVSSVGEWARRLAGKE